MSSLSGVSAAMARTASKSRTFMCSLSPFSSFFSHINPPAFAGGLRSSSIELCAGGDAVIRHQQMQLFLAVCKVGLLLRSRCGRSSLGGLVRPLVHVRTASWPGGTAHPSQDMRPDMRRYYSRVFWKFQWFCSRSARSKCRTAIHVGQVNKISKLIDKYFAYLYNSVGNRCKRSS